MSQARRNRGTDANTGRSDHTIGVADLAQHARSASVDKPTAKMIRATQSIRTAAPCDTGDARRNARTPGPAATQLLISAPQAASRHMSAVAEIFVSRGYEAAWVPRLTELAQAFAAAQVHVFVLEVLCLSPAEMTDLLELRRQYPAVRWILACTGQLPLSVEMVVKFQARGYIDIDDLRAFDRAIETVMAGELWFPRWLANALYFRLLSAVRTARLDFRHPADESAGALTSRESAALDLMRQGLSNKEIARRLAISVNTVKKHLKVAFHKRGLRSRREGLA